jgi:short-subunit dehydrogenase
VINFVDGKKILITGASSGIGRAIAIRLSRETCHLILLGRDPNRLVEAAHYCSTGRALSVKTFSRDLANFTTLPDWIHELGETQGGLPDILVHCAGTAPRGYIENVPLDVTADCLNLNTMTFIALCQSLVPHMKKQRDGQILAITSGHAHLGMPGFAAYSAAKAGLERICQSLSAELKPYNISVNLLSPGAVDTPPMAGVVSYSADLPLRRVKHKHSPAEVAERVVESLRHRKSVTMGLMGKLIRHAAYWAPSLLRRLFERS